MARLDNISVSQNKVDRPALMQNEYVNAKASHSGKVDLLACFLKESIKDLGLRSQKNTSPELHLKEAVRWLKHCHDCSLDHGVSWGYSLKGGWRGSYRETSGYIANTFFDLAIYQNDEDARNRAVSICEWLVSVQEIDGSIANKRYGASGLVFDTGQVLQGFTRAYEETQDRQFLEAAITAANWLINVSDEAGKWTKNTHNGIPHTYNARVAWKLLKLNSIYPDRRLEKIARSNLDWALENQQDTGLFNQCAFFPNQAPFIHTIAYAIRGLLESGILLAEPRYIEKATFAANTIKKYIQADGFIPGQIKADGKAIDHYCCLTGNCQMAIIWLKLFELTKDNSFYDAAVGGLGYVMASQDIDTRNLNVRGAIKGSQPIFGNYTRLSYPNWATKFFIDAILLLMRVDS